MAVNKITDDCQQNKRVTVLEGAFTQRAPFQLHSVVTVQSSPEAVLKITRQEPVFLETFVFIRTIYAVCNLHPPSKTPLGVQFTA